MNNFFSGRDSEIEDLRSCWQRNGSKLTVIYGRRRIGKSTLVQKAFNDKLLKFEGIEKKNTLAQKKQFVLTLSKYFKDVDLLKYNTSSWIEIFEQLSLKLKKKPTVILFDEVQWLAKERTKMISELKYAWDNYFKVKNNIHLILCGSVSSFVVKKVLRSKALYGRVNLTINLKQLYIDEIIPSLPTKVPLSEALDYYYAFGGVPAYWELIDCNEFSNYNFSKLCFGKNSYFKEELEKIFISHFGENSSYLKIVEYLSKVSYATHQEICKKTKLTQGGRNTRNIEDLELAGFIKTYVPLLTKSSSTLKRYYISDPFLKFYYQFIKPNLNLIENSRTPLKFKDIAGEHKLAIWRGFGLEKLCISHSSLLAKTLGFSDVNYKVGAFFQKKDQNNGFQIDLMFIRDDRVVTICEIKNTIAPVGISVTEEVKIKLERLHDFNKFRIQKVLITGSAPSAELIRQGYFDRILRVEDVFSTFFR